MPYVDDQLNRLTIWFAYLSEMAVQKGLLYGLVAVHWLTNLWQKGYDFTEKTVRGAMNAHRHQEFVFLERNSIPWARHDNSEELGVLRIQYPMIYHVDTSHFSFRRGDPDDLLAFNDVVTAELVNADETLVYDMSSFFHSVTYEKGDAPSLYEMALVYCLLNDLLFTTEQLSGFRVKILTAEAEEIEQRLDSTRSNTPFDGWQEYREREYARDVTEYDSDAERPVEMTPTATSASEDEKPDVDVECKTDEEEKPEAQPEPESNQA